MFRHTVLILTICAGCSALPGAEGQAGKWSPVGLCGGGGLFNPVVSPHDPKMMMAECDMGGRYISRDGGRMWRMIHHRQIGSAMRGAPPLFHPVRRGVIYALSGYQAAAVYVTRDNGRRWKLLPKARQPDAGVITRMFIDRDRPGRLFLGTERGEVLFTDDEGRTWQKAKGVKGRVFRFAADRTGVKGRTYFVGTVAGAFRSDDGGKSFVLKRKGLPEGKRLTSFAGGSDGKATILYSTVSCWVEKGKLAGGVYVSTDRGETWRRCMNPRINIQTKGTSPWRPNLPRYSHILTSDADPRRAYVACGGTSYFPPNHSTIYSTDDAGGKWIDTFFVDPRFKQLNVALDWMTSYRGTSWVSGPGRMEMSPVDPDVVMRTDGMFMFFTTDAGKTWKAGHAVRAGDATDDKDVTWLNNGLVVTTTWNYYVDPHEAKRHYIAYTDIGFARSLDRGRTWRWWGPGKKHGDEDGGDFPIPGRWINTCYELAFDPAAAGKIWGVFSGHHDIPNENSIWRGSGRSRLPGGICVSEDFGVTWEALRKGVPERPALSIVLDPKSPKGKRTLYAAIYDHGVYKSTDDGASWTNKSKGLGHPDNMRICRLMLHGDGTLFALITGMRVPANGPFTTKGVGLYRSTDGAESWELVNKSCPLVYPKDFGVDPADSRVIYVGACDGPRGEPPQGGLYRTGDGGTTWKRVMRKRATHFGAYFHPKRKGWIYATCCGWSDAPEGSLFLSTDAGKSWKVFAGLPFAQAHRVHFDPTDDSVIYVTTFGGSVWKGPVRP